MHVYVNAFDEQSAAVGISKSHMTITLLTDVYDRN